MRFIVTCPFLGQRVSLERTGHTPERLEDFRTAIRLRGRFGERPTVTNHWWRSTEDPTLSPFAQSSFRIVPMPRFLVNSELLLLPNRSR